MLSYQTETQMKKTIETSFYVEIDEDRDGRAYYEERDAKIEIDITYEVDENNGIVYVSDWGYTDVNADVPSRDEKALLEWCESAIVKEFAPYIVEIAPYTTL